MQTKIKVRAQVWLAVLSLAGALGASAQTADDLKKLVDQGKADEAYQLGRRSPDKLGDPTFDLFYGIAAVNSGRAAEGVLALERFVVAVPEHEAGRVELARGYYVLGDDARAKEEFQTALALKPPPAIARVINEYLDAIRAREAKYRPTAMAYFELGGGYDSNPRAGVDNPTLMLPVLGEVTVADSGLRVGDQTFHYGGGFRVTAPLAARAQVFAAGQAELVRYPDLSEFNQNLYSGSIGVQGQWNRIGWRAGATTSYQSLNRTAYRRTHGFFGDGSWAVNENNALSLGVQAGQFGYKGDNSVRNSAYRALSAGWKHLFSMAWRPEIDLSANGGREANVYDNRQDLSRDLYGARLGMAASPFAGWTIAASVLHQRSDYHEADPILQTTREDRYSAGDLSLAWSPLARLLLRAEVSSAKNDSNLALYEYRRRTALLKLRYEFR